MDENKNKRSLDDRLRLHQLYKARWESIEITLFQIQYAYSFAAAFALAALALYLALFSHLNLAGATLYLLAGCLSLVGMGALLAWVAVYLLGGSL